MAQAKRSARSEATRLADLVRERVDEGATTVEEIHKAIADLPLEVLQRMDVFTETVKDVRRIQDSSIGAVYDVIRKVNHEVTRLAGELLQSRAKRRAPKKTAKSRSARASANA
jgi:hypothetical protein